MKKVVVITGASSGIGEICASFLYQKGFTIYGLSRSKPNNENINYLKCDVTNKDEVIDVINRIYALEGVIDVVINNAGMGISGAFEYTEDHEIDKIMNVNVYGVINVCQAAIPYLRKSKGKIINIGSIAGEIAIPFQSFYSITKASVGMLSETLMHELRPFGIKVVCVMPGDTKTSFTKNREKKEVIDDLYKDRIQKSVSRMEKDEQNGKDPITVAKTIYRVIKKKNPKSKIAIGITYKLILLLKRILPSRLVNYIIYKLYAN